MCCAARVEGWGWQPSATVSPRLRRLLARPPACLLACLLACLCTCFLEHGSRGWLVSDRHSSSVLPVPQAAAAHQPWLLSAWRQSQIIEWSAARTQSRQQPQASVPTIPHGFHLPRRLISLIAPPQRTRAAVLHSCTIPAVPSSYAVLPSVPGGPCSCSVAWTTNLITGPSNVNPQHFAILVKFHFISAAAVKQKTQLKLCVWLLCCQQFLILAAGPPP